MFCINQKKKKFNSPAFNFDEVVALPEGTTSQRPSGSQKFIRFNSTTGSLELYNGNQWVEILSDYSQTGSTALG